MSTTPKIFESEYRFCLILWENQPIQSAALAALCYLLKAPSMYSTFGSLPGIKAFTAAVIGGIGSIPGAISAEYFSVLSSAFQTPCLL